MAAFERSTVVRAPLEAVWRFHTTTDGLEAVTPDWLGLAVESVANPDDAPDPDRLVAGSEVTLSFRPFGIGPRRTWTARVTRADRRAQTATIRDEMLDGPFPRWVHTHAFATVPGGTRVTDHVEYALPLGPARALSGLAWPAILALFVSRHRATRRLLDPSR